MTFLNVLFGVMLLLPIACSGGGETGAPSSETPADRDSGQVQSRSRFDPNAVKVRLRTVVGGLDAPLAVVDPRDGSDRLFVVEQGGDIQIVRGGDFEEEPFLDLGPLTQASGEQGLLGLAFHPDFKDNGRFFINFTDPTGDTMIMEFKVSPTDPDRADPLSGRVLMRIKQPFPNHNGGHLLFGKDGYLYIGMGDGGSGGDPLGNGQSLQTLLGKLLRIDVDSTSGIKPYGIPPDNPFAGGGGEPEIWAYGLRNPWRFTFDAKTNQLWLADVGQNDIEEVNRVPGARAPVNYGWNIMEGRACYEPSSGCDQEGLQQPITEYTHDDGCSITGGYVYRGRAFPTLRGGYFFGDFCSGKLWTIAATARGFAEPVELLDTDFAISSFGEDMRGELYVTDLSGNLLRLEAARS